MTSQQRKTIGAAALIGSVLIAVAGCAPAPAETGGTGDAASDFKPCIVAQVGGFDDRAFNELNLEGLMEAADELGVETGQAESDGSDQYAGNITAMLDNGCTLIETIGFDMADATREAAEANPDTEFVLVDSTLSDADGEPLELDNVKPVLFNTAEASYLAGYVAAAASKTGTVGTFGGLQIPPVTAFMDGFAQGVEKYNEAHGTDVGVVGWDYAAQNGLFIGDFVDTTKAANFTQSLIDQGADVIMPVAGTLVGSAASAARDSGAAVFLIGVDSDQYVLYPDYEDLFLTSVLKNMQISTKDVVLAAADDDFDSSIYTGTIANGGVGIADLYTNADAVAAEVLDEVAELQDQIADGTLVIATGGQ
ncbi:BMP family protein [Herbiconiux sp. L3-i23]|uniref:BMP family lipoprotein n=1 Tax=Herbiconiux sp. L3-i23 TaxID=2905871 RepID=UPI00205C451D|nr:BMP family ABC transporter substrate-binding protein [Herbiconiux sp. L3-i23]BDI21565.1 BMP family ABC transporter substrate-binding protein [Herbiconiux sp. L3-i23]